MPYSLLHFSMLSAIAKTFPRACLFHHIIYTACTNTIYVYYLIAAILYDFHHICSNLLMQQKIGQHWIQNMDTGMSPLSSVILTAIK